MKRTISLLLIAVMCLVMAGCGGKTEKKINMNTMTAEEIIQVIKDKGLPVGTVVSYTAETDTNNLLGKPNQYTSKVNFEDTRIKDNKPDDPLGGTIEVFNNKQDASARKKYIEDVTKDRPVLQQYMYLCDNILLRIENRLTIDQAKEYADVLGENSIYKVETDSNTDLSNVYDEYLDNMVDRILYGDVGEKMVGEILNGEEDKNTESGTEPLPETEPEEHNEILEYTLSAGNYYAGEDFPAGKYDIVWVSGNGNFNISGAVNEIFGDGDWYIKEFKNANIKDGDVTKVKGTLTVKLIKRS